MGGPFYINGVEIWRLSHDHISMRARVYETGHRRWVDFVLQPGFPEDPIASYDPSFLADFEFTARTWNIVEENLDTIFKMFPLDDEGEWDDE